MRRNRSKRKRTNSANVDLFKFPRTMAILLMFIVIFCSSCSLVIPDNESGKSPETIIVLPDDSKLGDLLDSAIEDIFGPGTAEKDDSGYVIISPDVSESPDLTADSQGDKAGSADSFTSESSDDEIQVVPDGSYLRVDYVDVGQADFIVIECDGVYATIDGGNVSDGQLVYSYLEKRGIDYIDTVVITHAHEDHCGGVSSILTYATAGTVYCPVTSYDTKAFKNVVSKVAEQGLELTVPNAGDIFEIGSAVAQIIGPVKSYDDPNDTSIVIRLTYGETSFLFTGDMESTSEADILDAGYDVSSDVLKVAHHGSYTSSSYRFLREVLPTYAIISSSRKDAPEYDHPHNVVLSRLRDADATIFRTDLQGTITCYSDGQSITFEVEKNSDADTLYELAAEQ